MTTEIIVRPGAQEITVLDSSVSVGGAGGTRFEELTQAEMDDLVETSALVPLRGYLLTDVSKIAVAISNNSYLSADAELVDGSADVTAPTITSSASASVAENATLAHTLTANESVTWSIVGGADQARFELSGNTLRWVSNGTKNYEAPNDTDTNNTYVVQVRATDSSSNVTNQTITVTVTNVLEVTLPAATISASTMAEESSEGTVVGTINNVPSGATVSLQDSSSNRFKLVGNVIQAGPTNTSYEDATSRNITVRYTHPDATNTPRDTVIAITITNVAEAPANISDLEAMPMGDGYHLMWTSAAGATSHQYRINGGTAVTTSDADEQMLDGPFDPGTYNFEVRGVNAEGNGNWSNIETVVVGEEYDAPVAPTLAQTSADGAYPFTYTTNYAPGSAYVVMGVDIIHFRWKKNGAGSWTTETPVPVDSDFYYDHVMDGIPYEWPLLEATVLTYGDTIEIQAGLEREGVTEWSTSLIETIATLGVTWELLHQEYINVGYGAGPSNISAITITPGDKIVVVVHGHYGTSQTLSSVVGNVAGTPLTFNSIGSATDNDNAVHALYYDTTGISSLTLRLNYTGSTDKVRVNVFAVRGAAAGSADASYFVSQFYGGGPHANLENNLAVPADGVNLISAWAGDGDFTGATELDRNIDADGELVALFQTVTADLVYPDNRYNWMTFATLSFEPA